MTKEPAVSLNHAFTLLSKAYEKYRISNNGTVYTRVFHCDGDALWYPLDDLRRGARATAERTLLQETCAQVEKELGWRPLPPPAQRRKRKRGQGG